MIALWPVLTKKKQLQKLIPFTSSVLLFRNFSLYFMQLLILLIKSQKHENFTVTEWSMTAKQSGSWGVRDHSLTQKLTLSTESVIISGNQKLSGIYIYETK